MGRKTSIVRQMDLLNPTVIPKSHRATGLTGKKNNQVFDLIRARSNTGMTPEEVEHELDWKQHTAGPRFAELRALGYVRQTESTRAGYRVWLFINQ